MYRNVLFIVVTDSATAKGFYLFLAFLAISWMTFFTSSLFQYRTPRININAIAITQTQGEMPVGAAGRVVVVTSAGTVVVTATGAVVVVTPGGVGETGIVVVVVVVVVVADTVSPVMAKIENPGVSASYII